MVVIKMLYRQLLIEIWKFLVDFRISDSNSNDIDQNQNNNSR